MINVKRPQFIVKRRSQKGGYLFSDILTRKILKDVCEKVTGCKEYAVKFDDAGYNKGRLAIIKYRGATTYISFSETGRISARNSYFQSVTTALVQYYQDANSNKKLRYYFLPSEGNIETNYFKFMYRLMATAGFKFLNADVSLEQEINPFNTIEDVINQRTLSRERNSSNNSTYITKNSDNKIQIYGKTYGANKKESTLLCVALSLIAPERIELYQICEKNLVTLPGPDLKVIESLGKITLRTTDLTMERNEFENNDSLRSPTYIYNLLDKLGDKKCSFCGCEISELVEGAHIWAVADIKKMPNLSFKKKLEYAIDGDNGLWLCVNHHKMLDMNLLGIGMQGNLKVKSNINERSINYIRRMTPITQIARGIFTGKFSSFLRRRNSLTRRNAQYSPL